MASTSLHDSVWKAAPSYQPLYLSTASEYRTPQSDSKLPPHAHLTSPDKSSGREPYENSLQIDSVFHSFVRRVSYENQQCLRYPLFYPHSSCSRPHFAISSYQRQGSPLPYAKDGVFDKLFPVPSPKSTTLSKSAFTVSSATKPTYSPSSATDLIPPCPTCQSPRTFECQLMPNLINVLQHSSTTPESPQSDQERRTTLTKDLKGGDGMSWGTAMVFSCEKDCCSVDDKEAKECWKEEVVVVQWDT